MASAMPSPSSQPPPDRHPYSAAFEDSLLSLLPTSASTPLSTGIRVIPASSTESPIPDISVHASDQGLAALPAIANSELPLPVRDPRRIFTSPVPGLLLSHPDGSLFGGTSTPPVDDDNDDDFAASFFASQSVSTIQEAQTALDRETSLQLNALYERLESRRLARERNEGVEKKLRDARAQHDLEVTIHKKMAEEAARRRQAKEARRREREERGGRG